MISWVPIETHAFYEKPTETTLRYTELALIISEVVLDANRDPVFEGEDGRIKTALLLASIASTESGYQKSSMTCEKTGDNGIAFGPWQTHTDKAKTCGHLENAANMALDFVEISFKWCNKGNQLDRLSGYTDGKCRPSDQSKMKISRALDWYNKHKPKFQFHE